MPMVKFLSKKQIRNLPQKELVKLIDSSKKFSEDIISEYYIRQEKEIKKALKTL